ncbi:unnamed protein product [Adineta ricciae]|nr:unnamed protein product [Adineta ricciae]
MDAFRALIYSIRRMTTLFISGLQTNFYATYTTGSSLAISANQYQDQQGNVCSCFGALDCISPATIFDTTNEIVVMTISGLFAGCLPVNSILLSTIECFYNQTCIDNLLSYFSTNEIFTAMKINDQSHFPPNSSIGSIVNRLMIEDLTINISCEKYFNQCSPHMCTYSNTRRHGIVFITERIIGLLGGLTLVLRLTVPTIARLIRRIINYKSSGGVSLCMRLRTVARIIHRLVKELNLFKQQGSNDHQIRHQRIVSRLFILLFVGISAVLALYIYLSTDAYYEIVHNPDENQFDRLQKNYSTSLSCPCSTTSLQYSTFLSIEPRYHQLCSSDFVSLDWITYVSLVYHINEYYRLDYRLSGAGFFYLVSLFCTETKETVDRALSVFLQTQLVNSQVLSREFFESQSNSLIQNWQSTTVHQFIRTIQLMDALVQGNRLNSGQLNVQFTLNRATREARMIPQKYDLCTCGLSPCLKILSIYNYSLTKNDYTQIFQVPHFYTGCYSFNFTF